MIHRKIAMEHDKKIALVAHDNKKRDLVEWAKYNRDLLAHHEVYATGTTGEILEHELGFIITKLQSGPLGGDQQIGAKISNNEIDFLIFFWDPLEPMPHDPDVKALLRMAVVWNIPIACNRASADFMISSPLMDGEYDRLVPDYEGYRTRKIVWSEEESQDAWDSSERTGQVTGDSDEATSQSTGDSEEGTGQVTWDSDEGTGQITWDSDEGTSQSTGDLDEGAGQLTWDSGEGLV